MYLNAEAYDAIQRFCDEAGVTMTAFLDALGEHLASGRTRWADPVITRARAIAADRRSRKPD